MNSVDPWIKRLHLRASDDLDRRVHADIDKALADARGTGGALLEPTNGFTKQPLTATTILPPVGFNYTWAAQPTDRCASRAPCPAPKM